MSTNKMEARTHKWKLEVKWRSRNAYGVADVSDAAGARAHRTGVSSIVTAVDVCDPLLEKGEGGHAMGRTRVCRRSASLRENPRWHNGRTPLQSDGANGAGRRAARLRVSVRSCGAGPKKKNRPNPPALGAIPDCPIAARCNAVISQA